MVFHAATHYCRVWWQMVVGASVMIAILVTNAWVAEPIGLKKISH
jgi:hypothetical protein